MQRSRSASEPGHNIDSNRFIAFPKGQPKYKRVDHIYDAQIRDWRIVDTTTTCAGNENWSFIVRRMFTTDGTLKDTLVEMISKPLRQAVKDIFPIRSVITTSTISKVYVSTLFHYRMELCQYCEKVVERNLEDDAAHMRLLFTFVDAEYKNVHADLQLLLDEHIVTYDFLWALFRPGDIVCTSTYYNEEEPRCFRVETVDGGDSLCFKVEGTYLDHDGKRFGMAQMNVPIMSFSGQRKVSDLAVYPLHYHTNAAVSY
jgi:hypothetical protein